MATALYFSDGSTTWLDMNSATVKLERGFYPASGNRAGGGDKDTIADTFRVLILGASTADVNTNLAALDQVTRYVERRFEEPSLPKLYLYFQIDGAAGAFRTELTEVSYSLDKSLADRWPVKDVLVTVSAVHVNYWEDATERQIALSNANGTSTTNALTVYSIDDTQAGRDNWVSIAADAVLGGLATPAKISFYNNYNHATRTSKILVGHNVYSSPATFPHVLEAESGTPIGSWTTTALSNNDYSGGYAKSTTLANGAEGTIYWTLNNALLSTAAGRMFRVLLHADGIEVGVWARVQMSLAGLNMLYDGPWVQLSTAYGIKEIDTVQIAPYLVGGTSWYDVRFDVDFKNQSGVNRSLVIDCIHLVPTDSYRVYVPNGFDLGYGTTLWDDPSTERVWVDWGASGAMGHYVAYGEPIMLIPGKAQRLYFEYSPGQRGLRTAQVKVWHRPRRRTL